ncbi:MAG: hypothetical protein OEZ68_12800 [Gammaproteobacteria bacterium]|nr:hypothetical protein [Gammaproteobacteria bacterium]MDH5801676.1 hypothetical protein [Gammaproteobacteria bacterium]
MSVHKNTGVALAVAAAGLFSVAPMASMAGESDAKVHCYGVNKCKGNNDCKSATNACKGQSACKGQGFVSISKEACDKVGGKVGK